MANKDPAFLFYPGDWMGGTMTLTRHQKGCYMDLLIAQFNDGPLSLETIKVVLGTDQATWTVLSKKFKKDSSGNFFNERLATEIQKRKTFIDRQSINGSKGGRPKIKPKQNPWVSSGLSNIENENRDVVDWEEKGGAGEKETWNVWPGPNEHALPLPEINIGGVQQLWRITKKQVISHADILDLWQVFKVQWLTGKKHYADPGEVYSHFINWTKTQKIERDGSNKKSNDTSERKLGTSEARMEAARKW